MIDISKDRIIIDMKDESKKTYTKSEWRELIVKSDKMSDIFSILLKKAIVQIQLHLWVTEVIESADKVLLLKCEQAPL